MTRVRGSEGMWKEVEKTSETSDSEETSFKDLVTYWEGPDDLAGDLVDLVWCHCERLAERLPVCYRQFFPLLYQSL